VASDLHDGLGQQLTGVAMMGKALERRLTVSGRPEAADAAHIARLTSEAIAQIRDLVRGLAPAELEAGDLGAALQALAATTERATGIACRVEGGLIFDAKDLSLVSQLYRIAQEAVSNAAKHARARRIDIVLDGGDERLTLRVTDDGVGLPSSPERADRGMGLRSIRYRADLIQAALTVERSPGGGTVVECSIPGRIRKCS
jgi:signal transduction histidine kinase